MLSFVKNNCRFCPKVFCCKKCRGKHEFKIHDVYPDCDICAYGITILKTPSDDLLNHIKSKHWPLHCVNCNRIFEDVHELTLHNKCPLARAPMNIINTPLRSIRDDKKKNNSVDLDSPSASNILKNTPSSGELFNNPKLTYLTTSTPRTYNSVSLNAFGLITPTETEMKIENCTEKTHNTTDEVEIDKQSKRRVTFNETPIYDSFKKAAPEKKLLKSSLKNSATPTTSKETSWYYQRNQSDVHNDPETPKSVATIWETASIETPIEVGKKSDVHNDPETPKSIAAVWEIASIETSIEVVKKSSTMYESCEPKNEIEDMSIEDISESNIAVLTEVQQIFKKSQSINVWTSMTCFFRNIVTGLSSTSAHDTTEEQPQIYSVPEQSSKRARIDDVTGEFTRFKKMKLTDIQCRQPINATTPYHFYVRKRKPKYSDRATQTD